MSGPVRDDRGGVTASVAVLPMVFTLFFVVIQVSLWYHGRTVAIATAHHALEAARTYRNADQAGDPGAGVTAGREFLDQVGGIEGGEVFVTLENGGEQMHVVVTAKALTVVPGLEKDIEVELSGPVEKIVP